MGRLRFLVTFFVNVLRVLVRRLREPPLRPTWTVRYEALALTRRTAFTHAQGLEVAARRGYLDAMTPRSFTKHDVTMTNVLTGGVPAMWITPKGPTGAPRPLIVYFHGGGYQFGSLEAYTDLLARLAVASKARVLAVDYRLAPEFPYPAALDDAIGVVRWLRENGHTELVFSGDAAGANLALATTLRLRELGEPLPLRAGLISPWVDLGSAGNTEFYACDTVPPEVYAEWARAFLGGTAANAPMVSPLKAELHGLPPLFVQVGGAEVGRADMLAFVSKARDEQVDITVADYEDMTHDWHLLAPMGVPQAQKAIDELGAFLGRQIAAGAGAARPAEPALPR